MIEAPGLGNARQSAVNLELGERAMAHVRRLAGEIGARPVGSRANHEAAAYVGEVFRAAGWTTEEQRGECPAWEADETHLAVDGEVLEVAANVYSPPCDIRALTVAVGTVGELRAADLGGRVAVLYGELTASPLWPKECPILRPERDQEIIRLLEEKAPAALITINPPAKRLTRVIEDWDFAIPSATVSARAGLALLRWEGRPARLRIASRRWASHSASVVARKAGRREERIVLCAHYDTKVDTPGAVDNAGGTAALLTLAEWLGGAELAVGLECVAFGAEDLGGQDDPEYMRWNGDRLGTVLVAVNMDGIGLAVGANTVAMMASGEGFRRLVEGLIEGRPGMTWVEPWPQSNHSTFAQRGVPSIALSATGAWEIAHLPEDGAEWVSAGKLGEVVGLVGEIVDGLREKSVAWTRGIADGGKEEVL